MTDSITETTSKSWFKRLGEALSGIVMGIVLVAIAIGLLFWNEGRSVTTARALSEGAGLVVSIDPSGNPAASEGKLVHFSGTVAPQGIAADTMFTGIEAPSGSTQLIRTVEMYQWRQSSKSETRKKLGGGEETVTTYSYDKVWSDTPIDSGGFKQPAGHENPPMPFESQSFSVKSGTVGAITLDGEDFAGLGDASPLAPDFEMVGKIRPVVGYNRSVKHDGESITVQDFGTPGDVGTIRIAFATRSAGTLSAVGKMQNAKLSAYQTSNGRNILMVRSGAASAKEMFDDAISGNITLTWLLRIGGFLLMLTGLRMVFAIVGVVGDVIPMIGDVFRFATGLAAFAIAALVSTLVIGFAWLWFRPLIGIAIIATGALIAFVALSLGKSKARAARSEGSAAGAQP
jgi:Transmembrane protein 43